MSRTRSFYPTAARYRVIDTAYIDDVMYQASTEQAPVFVDYAGHPGTALEPLDEEGRRRQRAYFDTRGQSVEAMQAQKQRLTEGGFDAGTLALKSSDDDTTRH